MPLYDLLSARPSRDARRTGRTRMKLAVPVCDRRHCRLHKTLPGHLLLITDRVASSKSPICDPSGAVAFRINVTHSSLRAALPADLPQARRASISADIKRRIRALSTGLGPATAGSFLLK